MNTSNTVKIAWYGKHFGEEPPLAGDKSQGAGGIFFSGCNLRCVYCQNYQISQEGIGKEYTIQELVMIMLGLQEHGCINIDLITPTIWWKQIKRAILQARKDGLTIPIVWNSNAYESIDILKEMDGLIQIYLPDFKYAFEELGMKYSMVARYPQIALAAIKEMYKQVGNLQINNSIAKKGLIVRHLILPNNEKNSIEILKLLAAFDREIFVSIMSQYSPIFKSADYQEINREISDSEFEIVFQTLCDLGFENGWVQEKGSEKMLIPNFRKRNPFAA